MGAADGLSLIIMDGILCTLNPEIAIKQKKLKKIKIQRNNKNCQNCLQI
jgi:hypothetical protein